MRLITIFTFFTLMLMVSCSDNENMLSESSYTNVDSAQFPDVRSVNIEQHTVFNAGDNGVNSYRIPSICTTRNGTLLAFCEARRDSWLDRSYTNIAMKRSTDNGVTWSEMTYLTSIPAGNDPGAFINPCPVVDQTTGKISLFTVFWKKRADSLGNGNVAYLITSDDDGITWSVPTNISNDILTESPYPGTENYYQFNYGFGPGSGIQMKGGAHQGRLIVPCSQSYILNNKVKKSNVTVYSDDHGVTWQAGNVSKYYAEYQIAESPNGTLVTNIRATSGGSAVRGSSVSTDGGINWSEWTAGLNYYTDLLTPAGGCQGGILSMDSVLYYSGPEGITATSSHDDRGRLALYKGQTNGSGVTTWGNGQLLYDKAAGYSCITLLDDGRLAILFEAGPNDGFTKVSSRPAGWMRLDLIIIPNSNL